MNIFNGICKIFNIAKKSFVSKKPRIMIVSGVVCLAAAVADGVYIGRRIDDLVEDGINEINHEKAIANKGEEADVTKAQFNFALKMLKLFGPLVGLTASGCLLIRGGYMTINDRLVMAISAADWYAGRLMNYRNEVIDEYGYEADQKIMRLSEKKPIDAEGRKIVSPDTQNVAIENPREWKLGMYTRFIGPYECDWWDPAWDINREYFIAHMEAMETECNRIFQIEQVVLANDVNKRLTIARDVTGGTIGWDHDRVDHISFGIDRDLNPTIAAFLRGDRDDILLNYNCCGCVLNALERKEKAWKAERARYWVAGK